MIHGVQLEIIDLYIRDANTLCETIDYKVRNKTITDFNEVR